MTADRKRPRARCHVCDMWLENSDERNNHYEEKHRAHDEAVWQLTDSEILAEVPYHCWECGGRQSAEDEALRRKQNLESRAELDGSNK